MLELRYSARAGWRRRRRLLGGGGPRAKGLLAPAWREVAWMGVRWGEVGGGWGGDGLWVGLVAIG